MSELVGSNTCRTNADSPIRKDESIGARAAEQIFKRGNGTRFVTNLRMEVLSVAGNRRDAVILARVCEIIRLISSYATGAANESDTDDLSIDERNRLSKGIIIVEAFIK